MKKYNVTLMYYGPCDSFGNPAYLKKTIEVEADSHVHAEWKAADLTGISQYYSNLVEEIKG